MSESDKSGITFRNNSLEGELFYWKLQDIASIFSRSLKESMHNLPLVCLSLACLLFVLLFLHKGARSFLKDLFSSVEDRWTWTTQTGEVYENVEIKHVEDDVLILKHNSGVTRLPIDSLSQESHDLLLHTPEWRDHESTFVPVLEKTPAFSASSMQASHAG